MGNYLDFRNNTAPVPGETGHYFTELVTTDVVRWLGSVIAPPSKADTGDAHHHGNRAGAGNGTRAVGGERSTFAYLAHESNHAPLEVPEYYIVRKSHTHTHTHTPRPLFQTVAKHRGLTYVLTSQHLGCRVQNTSQIQDLI